MKSSKQGNAFWRRLVLRTLCLLIPATSGFAADPPKLTEEGFRQLGVIMAEKAARTPAQKKMDSQLVHGARIARGQRLEGLPDYKPDLKVRADGRVLVDIDAIVTDALLAQIKAGGGQIIASVPNLRAIQALVSPVQAEALAGRADVSFIRPAVEAKTNTVTSQGDVAHGANTFRTRTLADGTGIRVGVLSDSVDYLSTSQSNGELGTVTVLSGQGGPTASGEGTAMLEIVHDLAPGAQLFFATAGFTTPTTGNAALFATNIRALRAAGCDIIIDDAVYANDSPFQDGPIAQAINDVSAEGALYFSAAGNFGNQNDGSSSTWEGDFSSGGSKTINGVTYTTHHFGGSDDFNAVVSGSPYYSSGRVNLFWADPLGASNNDYDLFVYDANGTTIFGSSTNSQTGSQDPYETVTGVTPGKRILIVKTAAAAARFLHLDSSGPWLTFATTGSTRGHNASGAANAFSVAATSAAAGTLFTGGSGVSVGNFSSDGPRRIFFTANGTAITAGNFSSTGGTVLQKPDITAADNVSTSVTGFTTFLGTSAAAPHAGAIAALLKSLNPTLTAAQIRTALQNSALDIESTSGVDRDSGYGIGMPLDALATLAVWVDFAAGAGNGTYATPYNTIANGVSNVPTAGMILIKASSTSATINIPSTKAMRIQSVGGTSRIGP